MENPIQFFQRGAAMFRPSLFVCNFYIFFIVFPKDIRINKESARGKASVLVSSNKQTPQGNIAYVYDAVFIILIY